MMQPIQCQCETCRSMCEHSTCLPTPDEARALIRAGHGGRLARYEFLDGSKVIGPAPANHDGSILDMTDRGCAFYRDGKCELHDAGLKPTEGRLAHHSRPWRPIRLSVLATWKGKRYESMVKRLTGM